MSDHNLKREQAQALGFSTVAECEEHQAWLDRQAAHASSARAAVQAANESGAQIIDARDLTVGL